VEQHQDGKHLAEGELATSPALAIGGEQVVTLPLLKELGKVIGTTEQGKVEPLMRRPSTYLNDTDTESGHA